MTKPRALVRAEQQLHRLVAVRLAQHLEVAPAHLVERAAEAFEGLHRRAVVHGHRRGPGRRGRDRAGRVPVPARRGGDQLRAGRRRAAGAGGGAAGPRRPAASAGGAGSAAARARRAAARCPRRRSYRRTRWCCRRRRSSRPCRCASTQALFVQVWLDSRSRRCRTRCPRRSSCRCRAAAGLAAGADVRAAPAVGRVGRHTGAVALEQAGRTRARAALAGLSRRTGDAAGRRSCSSRSRCSRTRCRTGSDRRRSCCCRQFPPCRYRCYRRCRGCRSWRGCKPRRRVAKQSPKSDTRAVS